MWPSCRCWWDVICYLWSELKHLDLFVPSVFVFSCSWRLHRSVTNQTCPCIWSHAFRKLLSLTLTRLVKYLPWCFSWVLYIYWRLRKSIWSSAYTDVCTGCVTGWLFAGWSPFSLPVGRLFIYLLVITVALTVPVWWYTTLTQGNLKELISVSKMDFKDLHFQAAGLRHRELLMGLDMLEHQTLPFEILSSHWEQMKGGEAALPGHC